MSIKTDTSELEAWAKKLGAKNKGEQEKLRKQFQSHGKTGGEKSSANLHNKLAAQNITKRANLFINASVSWAMKSLATRIQNDIQNKYNEEVRHFYDDYDPSSYDRTYSLFSAYKPVYYKKDNIYYMGAEIDGDNIPYTPYFSIYNRNKPMAPWYVFNLFYYQGSHGNNIHFVSGDNVITVYDAKETRPPAWVRMNSWWDRYRANISSNMLNEELQKAFKHNRSILTKG